MKIEFRCESCDSLLRMAVRFAGEAVDCPACHTLQWVPRESVSRRSSPAVAQPNSTSTLSVTNPESKPPRSVVASNAPLDRSCPECATPVSSKAEACQACSQALEPELAWKPTVASVSAIFRDTWAIYVDQLWLLVGAAILEGIMILFGYCLLLIPSFLAAGVLMPLGRPELVMLAMCGIFGLGLVVQHNVITASFCRFHLKLAKGEPVSLADALHIEWRRGAVSFLPTMYGFLLISGLLILVIPGVIVYLVLWPYCWVWADGKTGKSNANAFPLAKELTSRNMPVSFSLAGVGLALFFVNVLAFPFSRSLKGVLQAVAYLHMSGQAVGGRRGSRHTP